ncbi:MAG TPA: hypothetical protein VKB85_02195 [Propionibacteriaceae bacterium]|nr:hypothetical protein [Propionibacteriaceae bacterium]
MHVGGDLLRHLGLGEPDGLGRLQRCCGRFQLLQPGNPINPFPIGHLADIPQLDTTRDGLGQLRQHPVQPIGQRIHR